MSTDSTRAAGPVTTRAARGRPGHANAQAKDNPAPGALYVSGDLVVTPKGRTRAPQAGPATEMLDRLALAVGPEGLVMIGPSRPSWSYLVDPLASAWTITGGPAWFTATRGGTRLRLVLLDQVTGTNDPLMDPDPLTTVTRHKRFADLAGVPFYADGGSTGALLMEELVRPRGAQVLRAWHPDDFPRMTEPSWLHPGPLRGEYGATIRLDKNAYYLCAANSVQLPMDGLEHTGPGADWADCVGVWRIHAPENPEKRLPHPLGGRPAIGELRWVAHPTMELLADLGITVKVADSWTAPRVRARRLLVPWYERLRNARTIMTGVDDPDGEAIRQALKDTYSRGIGCLDRPTRRWSRPDWRAMIYATARCNMYRTLLKAGTEERRWPALVRTDSAQYEGAEPPAAFKIGTGMGQWKVVAK